MRKIVYNSRLQLLTKITKILNGLFLGIRYKLINSFNSNSKVYKTWRTSQKRKENKVENSAILQWTSKTRTQ